MAERVTIQDIADALGLSRNTVSKAFNNTGSLAASTRERILNKAIEMGYKQFSYMSLPNTGITPVKIEPVSSVNEIALVTRILLSNSHFASLTLDKFQQEITKLGYHLTIHLVLDADVQHMQLPKSLVCEKTAGIICFEMFDSSYNDMLCSLNIPILFVDTPPALPGQFTCADTLYMDNRTNILSFIREMKKRGKTRFGFIGESMHCHSFFERYSAFRESLDILDLPYKKEYCVIDSPPSGTRRSGEEYRNYISQRIQQMPHLPEVFICANDFVAIDVLQELRKLGISVPQNTWLCGFDDAPESRIITPPLTTIHIHTQIMGVSAAELLISRIREPSLNVRTVHTETTLIFRESTGD